MTYVLPPGAGGDSWYADTIVDATGDRGGVVLVAQSIAEVIDSGHLPALSRPAELAERLRT
jgi:hypothetical protein